VVADTLEELIAGMNNLTDAPLLDPGAVRAQIEARDLQMANPFSKDAQVQGIHKSRRYLADRLARTAAPHRILDPAVGPLIGVKLHILTRKSLGGIKPICPLARSGSTANPSTGCTPPGRSPASAAAASTDTTRWKGRSLAAASSRDASPAEQQQRPWDITAPAAQARKRSP
jgi:hypothetical protein